MYCSLKEKVEGEEDYLVIGTNVPLIVLQLPNLAKLEVKSIFLEENYLLKKKNLSY